MPFFPGIVYRPRPIYEDNTCCATGWKATKVGSWLQSLSYAKLDQHKYHKVLSKRPWMLTAQAQKTGGGPLHGEPAQTFKLPPGKRPPPTCKIIALHQSDMLGEAASAISKSTER